MSKPLLVRTKTRLNGYHIQVLLIKATQQEEYVPTEDADGFLRAEFCGEKSDELVLRKKVFLSKEFLRIEEKRADV